MSKLPQQTSLVTISILSEGQDIGDKYDVISIEVHKLANRIASAKIIIQDGTPAKATFAASEKDDFEPGKKIEIKAGYHSKEETIYKGIVISQNLRVSERGFGQLIVECRDEAIKLSIGRKNRYFLEKTDSDIIQAILGEYSLSSEVDSTDASHKEVIQYHTVDWDFIMLRAELNGMLVYVNDGKISIKKPELSASESLEVSYGDDLYAINTLMDARSQISATEATAWNYSSQEVVSSTGSEPSVNEQGNLSGSKLADVLGLKKYEMFHSGKLETAELKAWADAKLLKSRLAKFRGSITIQGNSILKVGDIIKINGLGARFSGKGFVSGLLHRIEEGNWTVDVALGVEENWFSEKHQVNESPSAGLMGSVPGLQIGTVLKLESDPDNEFRVQVKLPMVDSKSEGIWARISRFYASKDIGAFFMPEIGDEVIVGFINEDPRFPIILGMFNSSKLGAPLTPADANPQKKLVTKSKLSLLFDDEKKIVEITTPGKNTVTISDEGQSITLLDQNKNKVELSSSGILLDSKSDINIKAAANVNIQANSNISVKANANVDVQGLNVSNKANAQFSASGNAGAELKTSAIAVIQGTLVKIN
ncbi:MAG: type VI secretion system tip protein VgrG [Bacteroidia bacterium]|nr:type VI secretion system tip protein VgrG [Bacteroidia bacterium]